MSKKQKMDLTEKLENIHGGNLIVQDGTTKLRSIFDFVKYEELFAFVEGCKLANSILIFENEGLTIKPTESNLGQNIQLAMYASICEDSTMVKQYLDYIMKISCDGKREPTLYKE